VGVGRPPAFVNQLPASRSRHNRRSIAWPSGPRRRVFWNRRAVCRLPGDAGSGWPGRSRRGHALHEPIGRPPSVASWALTSCIVGTRP